METLKELQSIVDTYSLGDFSSIIALLITFVGFIVTIFTLFRTKTAAVEAGKIATKIQHDFKKLDSATSLGSAIASMEEIKRMHRQEVLDLLPDRYSNVRKYLITIRGSHENLDDDSRTVIQNAIAHFSKMESSIEKAIQSKENKVNFTQLNSIVSKQIDEIQAIQISLRAQIGSES